MPELREVQIDVKDQAGQYGLQSPVVAEVLKIKRVEASYTTLDIRDFTGKETQVLVRGRSRPTAGDVGRVAVFMLAGETKGKYTNYSGFYNPAEQLPPQYVGKRPPVIAQPDKASGGGGGAKGSGGGGGNEDVYKNRGVALSYAKDLVVADKIGVLDIPMFAKAFAAFIATGIMPSKATAAPPAQLPEPEYPEMGEQKFPEEASQDVNDNPYATEDMGAGNGNIAGNGGAFAGNPAPPAQQQKYATDDIPF